MPRARSAEPGTRSPELGAQSLDPGTESLEPGSWELGAPEARAQGAQGPELGACTWSLEPGARAWSLESGARSLRRQEPGSQCPDPRAWIPEPRVRAQLLATRWIPGTSSGSLSPIKIIGPGSLCPPSAPSNQNHRPCSPRKENCLPGWLYAFFRFCASTTSPSVGDRPRASVKPQNFKASKLESQGGENLGDVRSI